MDYIAVSDAARVYVGVLGLLLIVLFARLAIQRAYRYGIKPGINPHPLTSVGLMLVFGNVVARRNVTVGQPGDVYLWVAVAAMTLTTIGMALAVRWRRPGRRRPDDTDQT